jgi:hypothetical protein
MHCPTYRPALYNCPFLGCKKSCKKASGLTRHQTTCSYNPKNRFVFPPMQNDPPFLNNDEYLSDPHTPSSPPQTPPRRTEGNEVPPTPSQATPRRNVWTAKGCSGIYIKTHPYLDGKSQLAVPVLFAFSRLMNYCRYSM